MIAEVIKPMALSVGEMLEKSSELYYLHISEEHGKPILTPVNVGSLGILKEDSLLMRIVTDEEEIPEPVKKTKPVKHQKDYRRPYEIMTYKFNGQDESGNIRVNFRADSGGIRIHFPDKESAEIYFDYFREQFYTKKTGASVITVSNIYKDLNLVNWNPEDCDDWGWYTLDGGTCRYISSYVTKNKNEKRYGFSLSKPVKLYESKRKED